MAATATADPRKEIGELSKKNADLTKGLDSLTQKFDNLVDKLSKTPARGSPSQSDVFGAPGAIVGESPNSSRGFSLVKMLGNLTGSVPDEDCKVEKDLADRLGNVYTKSAGDAAYAFMGSDPQRRALVPLATSFMQESVVPHNFRREMKERFIAGAEGADLDEMRWARTKQLTAQGYGRKDLSWLTEFLGGSLVAPPDFGELIELLRNKEALVNAGARTVPLPPQGRIKYPRQTAPSLTYWVGENAPITTSDIGTGEVTLQAKKLAVLLKAPNELIRFASPSVEALIRDDMTKSLALALDLACLEGTGGDTKPEGLILKQNINRLTSSRTGADGDYIVGNDIYRFLAAIEESNAEMEGFIMRPKTLYKYYQLRFDAVAQGDAAGGFLFNLIREAGEGVKATLAGKPVTTSTQVSQSRAKGSATNLTYILGGMWSDCLIGMFGAVEFAATTLGDTPFTRDQTWVRGILSADFNVRHEAAFAFMDNLSTLL